MKNALKIIAFANVDRIQGTIALLDVAQRAMDEDGYDLAAAFLDMAREAYFAKINEKSGIFSEVCTIQSGPSH